MRCIQHNTQNDRGRAVEMAMLPPPHPDSMVLAGEEQKEDYAKPCTEGREVSYMDIGLTTVAVNQDLLSGCRWF